MATFQNKNNVLGLTLSDKDEYNQAYSTNDCSGTIYRLQCQCEDADSRCDYHWTEQSQLAREPSGHQDDLGELWTIQT